MARGIDGYLFNGPEEIDPGWLTGKRRIGVPPAPPPPKYWSSGSSTASGR